MRIVPLFKCKDLTKSIDFYTRVLDFELKYKTALPSDGVVDLIKGNIELQLTIFEREQLLGSVVNIWVDEVDQLFKKYLDRGLDITAKINSPVHQGPLNQTWGTREFYINDPDGNTLRFCKALN